jgi:hypothetical protein
MSWESNFLQELNQSDFSAITLGFKAAFIVLLNSGAAVEENTFSQQLSGFELAKVLWSSFIDLV